MNTGYQCDNAADCRNPDIGTVQVTPATLTSFQLELNTFLVFLQNAIDGRLPSGATVRNAAVPRHLSSKRWIVRS
jgi:hypothetical protein